MELLPGDIGFARIPGRLGAWVSIGQALIRDPSHWTHAFLVLRNGQIIEAMPTGARIRRAPLDGVAYARLPLTERQRADVAQYGWSLAGTPYSFADYAALATWRWSLPGRSLLRSYVSDSGHMICSQLVDHALCAVGFHLFEDGRLPQDVTPGSLFYRTEEVGVTL